MDLASLIPTFGNIVWTIAAFIAALSVIVAIHEYGHYIVGRWSGIKADVFSIGFGPVLASRVDKHGTRWQVAALPFGGFVKFRGDAGAASDKDVDAMNAMSADEQRATMHGAPLWARTATVAAGPVFNFILSFVIFFCLIMYRGVTSDPITVEELLPLPASSEFELRSGDVIVGLEGQATSDTTGLSELLGEIEPAPSLDYLVERDGEKFSVPGPWLSPPVVGALTPRWAAARTGMLEEGDVIVSVDGEPIFAFSQLLSSVLASEGRELNFEVWRNGETFSLAITPDERDYPLPEGGFETRWILGISGGGLPFTTARETPPILDAAERSYASIQNVVTSSFSALYHMTVGKISPCNLSGPIGIARLSGHAASQGWFDFISMIALLSTAVGLINLFPIPVLDGGHLVFYAFEAVVGRPPSDRALRYLMAGGLTIMLALMLFAVTNDIFCP